MRLVLPVAMLGALLGGCVERIVAVRSEPEGAEVYLDDQKVGETPCEVRYVWYGTRELVVRKKGYRGAREWIRLDPPWWQIFPLDFITDVLLPFTVADRVRYAYVLEPAPADEKEMEKMRRRAAELREKAGPSR